MGSISGLIGRWFSSRLSAPGRSFELPSPSPPGEGPRRAGAPSPSPLSRPASEPVAAPPPPLAEGASFLGAEPPADVAPGPAAEAVPRSPPSESVDAFVESFFEGLGGVGAPAATEEPGSSPQARPEGAEPEPVSPEDESPEAREMFGGIAATYVRPVRQFVGRLEKGPVATEWVEICLPAVAMVGRSAGLMGFSTLLPSLERFEAALRGAGASGAATVAGEARDAVLTAFQGLREALPEAFAPQEGEDQRDTVIVHALLRQVPDVGKVTLDKIFGAGLTTVEMLERASPADLTETTGVSARLSERICGAVTAYAAEREARSHFDAPEVWLEALRPLLAALEEHHVAFLERSGYGAEDAAVRRAHRRAREAAALRLDVLLAEMGEVQLVDEIQGLPFDHRIRRLREFAATLDGRDPAGAGPPPLEPLPRE